MNRKPPGNAVPGSSLRPANALDAAAATTFLKELPPDQREVVVARIWGGLTFQQIGELIGTTDSTAHRRYESALAAITAEIEDIMSEKRLNEELAAIEIALASLKPAASRVDRDRVMFLAGRAL